MIIVYYLIALFFLEIILIKKGVSKQELKYYRGAFYVCIMAALFTYPDVSDKKYSMFCKMKTDSQIQRTNG